MISGERMADPLAPYRRKNTSGPATSPPVMAASDYVAFAGKDRCERLEIRRKMAPARAPRYFNLDDIAFDPVYGTNVALIFTRMVVLVRGKNLQAIIVALKSDMAEFIQEFDPDRWEMPKDTTAPFIESIEVIIHDGTAGLPDSEEPGGGKAGRDLH
jgi:hypothetical protein